MFSRRVEKLADLVVGNKLSLEFFKIKMEGSNTPEVTETAEDSSGVPRFHPVLSGVNDIYIKGVSSPKGYEAYLEILPFLSNVTSLRIDGWGFFEFEKNDIIRFLWPFRTTVRRLEIHQCLCDSAVLIFLTSLFTCIDDLRVNPLCYLGATYRIQDSDRFSDVKFQGTLVLTWLEERHKNFMKFVKEHSSNMHSIYVDYCEKEDMLELLEGQEDQLSTVGIGLGLVEERGKFTVAGCHTTHHNSHFPDGLISLSCYTQLRTLSIRFKCDFNNLWKSPNLEILDTIPSSSPLEEIKLYSTKGLKADVSIESWGKFDTLLCNCYDRSYANNGTKLCVSLQLYCVESEQEYDWLMERVGGVWPKFLQKGIVKIVPFCLENMFLGPDTNLV